MMRAAGSGGAATLRSLRSALATSVASAALMAYGSRPVHAAPPAGCTVDATLTIVTCTGDQSGGISINNGSGTYSTLNVQSLTTDIDPSAGATGILFTSNGPVTLNANPGAFAIITTDANGIFASSNGGAVTIQSTADIQTSGGSATGIQGSAQNELLTITSSGDIATSGNNAFGIAAGTVYGGVNVVSSSNITTQGTFAAAINVGTIGQLGTRQGAITIFSSGNISTSGDTAIGINAASVYGPITITSMGNVVASGANSIGISASTNGDITINSQGNISSSGSAIRANTSSGLVTITSSGNLSTTASSASGIAVSGDAGVIVTTSSNVRTYSNAAPGITVATDGNAAVASSGRITTAGASSDGISVVSTNGTASVINTGDVSVAGTGSAGIYAAGFASSTVTNLGTVVAATSCCAAVMQGSAGASRLLNFGTIDGAGADYAIDNAGASNVVLNFGTVAGNVRLTDTGGGSTFVNEPGALFNAGSTVTVGTLVNAGTLAPGGSGTILTTAVDDDFTQTSSGTLAIDLSGASADKVVVSDTAALAGNVYVSVLALPPLGPQSYVLVQGLTGVTNDGLTLSASPALHGSLTFTPTALILSTSVAFTIAGLNGNQLAIATTLNGAYAAGGGGLTPVLLGLLNTHGIDAYEAALNQLSPQLYSEAQVAALYASLRFSNSLLSCRVNGAETASIIHEGECLWAGASAVFLDSGTTNDQIGFNQSAGLFAAGVQVALDPVWRLGFAGGYQSSTIDTASGAQSETQVAQGGVALKYNPGALLLAGTVTAGHGWYDTSRPMAFGGFAATPSSRSGTDLLSFGARAAYVIGSPKLYVKPVLDLAATRLGLGGFDESGGGAADLSVQSSSQTVLSAAPSVEMGTEWWLANGTLVRPYVRGGATFYGNGDLALTANFLAAPAGVAPFTIETKQDDVMGLIGAGLDLINGGDAVLHLGYDGQLGTTTQVHAVVLKGSAKF